MIFTQADRQRIERTETALVDLRLDVGLRVNSTGKTANSLHVRLNDAFAVLNELGAALGRIESAIKPLSKLGLETGARQTDRKVLDEILSGYNSDRILEFEDMKKALRIVVDTVNRRADESLDVVRGLSARVDNLQNSPLTPLGEALATLPDTVQSVVTREQMTHNAILALSARVGELTGLMQAEVSEASRFRKDVMQVLSCFTDVQRTTAMDTTRRLADLQQKLGAHNRELFDQWFKQGSASERLNANKRKARRKKK